MLAAPSELARAYDALLRQHPPAAHRRPCYRKWLRFYLDFCSQYGLDANNINNLPAFIHTLAEQGQSHLLQHQAQDAVSLYCGLIAARQPPGPIESRTATSSHAETKGGELNHRRSFVAFLLSHQPQSRPERRRQPTPKRLSARRFRRIRQACHRLRSDKPYPAPAANSRTHPPGFERQICEPVRNSMATPEPSGANWAELYTGLEAAIRLCDYSPRTLAAYRSWYRKLQTFVSSKDPALLAMEDIKGFLRVLADEKQLSASSQNQAFNALVFLFTRVLGKEFGQIEGLERVRQAPHIPVVLSRDEVDCLLANLCPPYSLVAKLLYGCGLRLFECLNLRVRDVNVAMKILTVHDGKGRKDRTLPLPESLTHALKRQFDLVAQVHGNDLAQGYGGCFLPDRLEKTTQQAAREYPWQWLFPAKTLTRVAEAQEYRRYHLHESHVQKAIKRAVQRARITKKASAQSLRHSFASHLLQANYDIRTISRLLGHHDLKTTMIYTRTVPGVTLKDAKSPLDF